MKPRWGMWLVGLLGRRRDFDGPVAGFAAEVNPEVVKLTDSGVRKLLLRIDGRVCLELVVPDAKTFLDEVWACTQWVEHGDAPPAPSSSDGPSDQAARETAPLHGTEPSS